MTDQSIAGALIDLDGTVYLGDRLLPGADEGIRRFREAGVSVLFLSNKAIDRRESFRQKLLDLGVSADPDEVVNSAAIAASYLAEHHAGDAVYVIGEDPLRDELREQGLELTDDPAETDVLLASMDRTFDYETLTDALHALDDDTVFLATNPDRTCPIEGGEIPDCGAVVGAIEGATGRELDRVLGKPSTTTVEAATSMIDVAPERCVMIGDRLETDILMGNEAGMQTALVMTGVTDRETLAESSIRPDYVLESLADAGDLLEE